MIETYSCLDGECKYYISLYFLYINIEISFLSYSMQALLF